MRLVSLRHELSIANHDVSTSASHGSAVSMVGSSATACQPRAGRDGSQATPHIFPQVYIYRPNAGRGCVGPRSGPTSPDAAALVQVRPFPMRGGNAAAENNAANGEWSRRGLAGTRPRGMGSRRQKPRCRHPKGLGTNGPRELPRSAGRASIRSSRFASPRNRRRRPHAFIAQTLRRMPLAKSRRTGTRASR